MLSCDVKAVSFPQGQFTEVMIAFCLSYNVSATLFSIQTMLV